MRYVTNGKGELVVISRSGEIIISDQHGRERERHKLPYGATLNIKPDQQIKAGTVLANWDPLTRPIITEFAGKARFENVEEGVTVAKQVDEVTGLSTLVVIDPKRRGADQGRASAGQAARRCRPGSEDPRHRPLGDDRLPGRCADPGA
jgi:DNA-directed RNA polymerase subunit beta'